MGVYMLTTQMALAASGCGTVMEITAVNTAPMADIYRLDKRGIATGGLLAQMLYAFTPLGIVASAVSDSAAGIAGSAVRRNTVEGERKQELSNQKWDGVFEVSYKPDFGDVIRITIRDSEIKRYGLEKGSRVVMYDPDYDTSITTDEGKKVIRTRPSIHTPVSGLFSTKQFIPLPINGESTDDYKKVCYSGQEGPDYRSMSGPWNSNSYKRPPLTSDELDEARLMINRLRSDLKDRQSSTDAEKNQTAIDLQVLELADSRLWRSTFILMDRTEKALSPIENRIALQTSKLSDLKRNTGIDASPEIENWVNFVNESMSIKVQEHLDNKTNITPK